MEEVNVRDLVLGDLAQLVDIDHSYHTDYVWQMDFKSKEQEVEVRFKEVRLPRSMRVDYPRDSSQLVDDWKERDGVLVAERNDQAVGYISMTKSQNAQIFNITDLVVLRRMRRQGIGAALLFGAQTWAQQHNANRLLLDMQSKNYPSICLATKLGYEFCGYSDRYYPNQDIALFFSKRI